MTSLEVDNLFAQTLSGGEDDDAPWNAIHALRRIGTREVFEYAAGWCKSNHALKRSRGASVLAQLGKTAEHPRNSFAVACALGSYPNDPQAVPALLDLTNDTDEDVRDWAVFGLGNLGDSDSPE